MTAAKQLLDDKFLKNFAPLGDLDSERFSKIARNCIVEQYDAGTQLFQIGDRDNRTIYLLSGQVTLRFRSGTERIITAETNQARNALVPEQPRQATATAKTPISILVIDSDALDQVLHWNDNGYEISELEDEQDEDNDWMTMFLQSKAFLKLRAQNIQALMMRLEEIPVKAGHVIVRQGDDDGYYYIVKRGQCRVSRKPTPESPEIEVAVLGVGAGFGEEALIMHDTRGATVTMVESGLLMRLSRSDFTRLLAEPLVQIVSYRDVVRNPKSVFLDVRAYDEYVNNGIKNSENSPLPELRARIDDFDSHKQYVIVSNNGGRASAAAFLLCQQGLDAVVLERGLLGLPDDVLRGNADLDNIPTVDNVVNFNKSPDLEDGEQLADDFDVYDQYDELEDLEPELPLEQNTLSDEELLNDPRVNAIFAHAKQRLTEEAYRSKAAEDARLKAEQEVARLKKEAEKARIEAEKARKNVKSTAHQSAEAARVEAIKEAARLREVELNCKQAEMEEAIRQAEEEAQRAHHAEIAYREAHEENARLKREVQEAIERSQEETRKTTQALQIFAELEAKHYRDAAKKRAEQEARRIADAEESRRRKQADIERLKVQAEEIRQQLEQQARISADSARPDIEQEAARLRAESLATEQAEKEREIILAQQAIERSITMEQARRAQEAEIEKLRDEAERARSAAAEQAQIAADQGLSRENQEAARKKAQDLAEKQLEIEEAVRRAEAEAARTLAAEEARLVAEAEIERVKSAAASERARIEEQALRIAEAAREEAERKAEEKRARELAAKQSEIDSAELKARQEAERARVAEEARMHAEAQIERLKNDAEQTRIELEKRLSADISRSEMEHEVARVRAEELVNKQAEIDEIARAAEQASLRAMAAEEARLNAEQEMQRLKADIEEVRRLQSRMDQAGESRKAEEAVNRKQAEIAEIKKRLDEEDSRVQLAEDAQRKAQDEIDRLRAEVASLTQQAQQQLSADVERAALENAAVRQQAQELTTKQQQIEAAIQQAQQEARRAQEAIEARVQAEEQVKLLKQQNDLAYYEAQEMLRRSERETREQFERELEQARAEEAARRQQEVDAAARIARDEARRAEAAEKARMDAEREIERLKAAAEIRRIKAEKAIKESIKTARRTADNKAAKKQNTRTNNKRNKKQSVKESPVKRQQQPAVDYFADEPPTDLQVQDDMDLLFTSINVGGGPKGAADRIKAMSNEPDNKDDKESEEDAMQSSAWVSDQVMWEATLGIREDEKAQTIITPDKPAEAPQFFGKDTRQQQQKTEQWRDREDRTQRSVFNGRELNPHLIKTPSARIDRRRLIATWAKKVKILLWLSPLIVATGYYFTLGEQQRIDLQLKVAGFTQNLFGSSHNDIAKDAKQLVQETEARLEKQSKDSNSSAKAKSSVSKAAPKHQTAKRSTSNTAVTSTTERTPVAVNAKTFSGKDIPFEDETGRAAVIPAPMPGGVPANVPDGQPILPPIPDAAEVIETTQPASVAPVVNPVSEPRAVANGSSETVSGRTGIGELPPVSPPEVGDNEDVNADQNTAIFGGK